MTLDQVNNVEIYAPGIKCGGCLKGANGLLQELDSEARITDGLETKHFVITSKLDQTTVLEVLSKYDPEPWNGQLFVKSEATTKKPETEQPAVPNIKMALEGMTCASCVSAVNKALHAVPGVTKVQVNFASRQADIYGQAEAQELTRALQAAGYDGVIIEDPEVAQQQQQAKLLADYKKKRMHTGIGLFAGLGLMFFGADIQDPLLQRTIGWTTFAFMLLTGRHFYISGYKALRTGHANMDTLVALGTGSAWVYSITVVHFPGWFPQASQVVYFEAAVIIIALVNMGQALELHARRKTQASLNSLLDLRVSHARVVRGEAEEDIPVSQVQIGDVLRLRPGDRVAVDGEVTAGQTNIDEAMLTGEPVPVHKLVGDKLAAGTINMQGSVLYRATHIGQQTALARIIELVRQAQNSKPAISRLADQVAAVFVPVVMVIALITAFIWMYFGPEPALTHALVSAVSVLIIACPCALGLATPISVMLGVGKAAELGVLVRNADALQVASKVEWILVDKTGTLTQGKPRVVDFACFNDVDSELVKSQAKAMEQASEHPLAAAILEYCGDVKANSITDFTAKQGLGLLADEWALGNVRLMQEQQVSITPAEVWLQEQAGNTVMLLAKGDTLYAAFALADPIRSDSSSAITRLHQAGTKVMMLTGDNLQTAEMVARHLGIDEYKANLMPEDKLKILQDIQAKGHKVAMVGDGINDAPALSQADVGFAIGGGTDVAMESADMCLLGDSLHGVADAIELSHATLKNIRQNLWGAYAYNSLGIPVAAGLLFPFTGMLLSPMLAGLAMSLSSVTVVTNANRLRLFKPRPRK